MLGLKEGGVGYAPVRVDFPGKAEALAEGGGAGQRACARESSRCPSSLRGARGLQGPALISLQHIRKAFGAGVRALDDVSLEVRPGERARAGGRERRGQVDR